MIKTPIFQVDAFTNRLFHGNPAAVMILEKWPSDQVLKAIAQENNLAETAFILKKDNRFHLRWFTPEIEMDLCGHATLAAAHVIYTETNFDKHSLIFESASGDLNVTRQGNRYTMDFPSREPKQAEILPEIDQAFNIQAQKVLKARDYVLVYESEAQIRALNPKQSVLDRINLDPGGVVATAPGNNSDFVSRFFTPQASIFEDPVTGSAHCSLIPYWCKILGKETMVAHQLSARGGELYCEYAGDRVFVGGHAVTYSKGYTSF